MLGDESYFIKKMEKVGILSSGLRISFSSLTLKEMLGDESHRLSGKGGVYRPAFAFLFPRCSPKEMLGDESDFIKKRKRWLSNRPASHFYFLAEA